MLKFFNFFQRIIINKNIQGLIVKKFCHTKILNISDKILNCTGRQNKFYILASNLSDNINIQDSNTFYLSKLYSRFYKLKHKTVVNPIFESNENSVKNLENKNHEFDFISEYNNKEFNQNMYEIFVKNNLLIERDRDIFLNLKNSNFFRLDEIESDNHNTALRSGWSLDILKQHSQMLQKNTNVTIKFSIVNEIEKDKQINIDLHIPVEKPEFLFGVTFLTVLNGPNNEEINSLGITKILEDGLCQNKSSFLLPTKIYAINPINEEKIPIVIINKLHCNSSNFNYVFRACVPGHNHIDFQLAKENSLPIKYVVKPISEMGETVSKKDETHPGLILKSMDQIKQEINKKKLSDGPKLINSMDGFLVNCKEFDFLYLDEACELIVNNLIRKGKAQRIEQYNIENWHIAKKSVNNEILFEESFIEAIKYLRLINFNKQVFKIWLPVDIYISESNNIIGDTGTVNKNIFYARIIHKIFLNLFKENLPVKNCNTLEEEVYINKEHELEKDIFFPAPYLYIINISDKNIFLLDEIKHLIKNIEKNITIIYENILQSNSSMDLIFDIEKLRDEKYNVNQMNNFVVYTYMDFIKIVELIETHKIDNLKEGLVKFSEMIEELLRNSNKEIIFANKIFLSYLYMNYLLILYVFSPEKSSSLYSEFYNKLGIDNQIFKSNIEDYSVEKLYSTCKYFIDMLNNSKRLDIIVNNQSKSKIIVDKIAIENKEILIKLIEEVLEIKINQSQLEEFILNDDTLFITIK